MNTFSLFYNLLFQIVTLMIYSYKVMTVFVMFFFSFQLPLTWSIGRKTYLCCGVDWTISRRNLRVRVLLFCSTVFKLGFALNKGVKFWTM